MDSIFCYHVVLLVVATLGFVFVWIGAFTPGWLAVTFQETEAEAAFTVSSLNRSLFYDLHCPQELKDCTTCTAGDESVKCVAEMGFTQYSQHFGWIETITAKKEEWLLWRILMVIIVIAASMGFILVCCLVCCMFRTYIYRAIATSAFFFWLIAGLLMWVPVGMVANLHAEITDEVNAKTVSRIDGINHDASLHIPYALVIAAIAGFLALIAAIMLIWLTGVCESKKDKRSDDSRRSDTMEVFSDRSYKSGIYDQRYYGPQPYYQPDRPAYYTEQEPSYYPRNGDRSSNFIADDYQHYSKQPAQWGPNPWYDNRNFT